MNKEKVVKDKEIIEENYFNCKEGDIFLLKKDRKKKDSYIAYDKIGRNYK